MRQKYKPRLIRVTDMRGDDLTPPRLVQELLDADAMMFSRARSFVKAGTAPAPTVADDLQATRRRPIDDPMATPWEVKTDYRLDAAEPYIVDRLKVGMAELLAALSVLMMTFGLGLLVGRWL